MNNTQRYRVGVIDLGSNTARLIVISALPGYSYRLEDQVREVVRLRQGMTAKGLSQEAMARAFSTLRLFKRFCDSTGVEVVLPTATSAVRDAANGAAFMAQVEREIGLSLQVLSGEREAYYSTLGVLNEIAMGQGFVLDIGGGSVQISRVTDRRFDRGQSLTLGALALTERFVDTDPASEAEVEAVQKEIDRQLDTVPWLQPQAATRLAGLGGTIRNLAKIERARQNYPLGTLHGFSLTRSSVAESIELFRELPQSEREDISGLSSDRADIILPGAMVLASIMDRLDVGEVLIAVNGLREGVFFEHFLQHLPYPVIPDVRRFGVLNLARNYDYHKSHVHHVRFLAGRLFEQLAPLHGYGGPERELLSAAAMLHDVGTVVGYSGHHKHSQTLVEYNGLPGYTPREIALIGLLVRYHRKGMPDTSDYQMLLSKDDDLLVQRLVAILRTAEYLERGRSGAVDDVSVTWENGTLQLTLIADEYPRVELWDTQRNALPLLEKAFGRCVHVDCIAAPDEWPEAY